MEFKDFILDLFKDINGVSVKPMMGEYLLYVNRTLVGGIYDNRLLLKKVNGNKNYKLAEELPYIGAKTLMLVAPVDDAKLVNEILVNTFYSLIKS